MYAALNKLLNLIAPTICILCLNKTHRTLPLCAECENDSPTSIFTCVQCGLPTLDQMIKKCGQCLKARPFFDRTIVLYQYEQPAKKLILDLKFHEKLIHACLLGKLMAEKISQDMDARPDLIIPVPLHKKRIRTRGFNQALELAKPIAKQLQIPIDYRSVVRHKHTEPQLSLPLNQRAKNIKKAFALQGELSAKHVAIVDDVMTTGATVNALSQLLKANGVHRVDVWCCARTSKRVGRVTSSEPHT